nr:Conserved hypothetical protein [Methylocystis sp. SC2]
MPALAFGGIAMGRTKSAAASISPTWAASVVVLLLCGSRSRKRTRLRLSAKYQARCTAIVLLPTPPFSLFTTSAFMRPLGRHDDHDWRPP